MTYLNYELRRIGKMHSKPRKMIRAFCALQDQLRSKGWITCQEAAVLAAAGVDPKGKLMGVKGPTIRKRLRDGVYKYSRRRGPHVLELWADEVVPPLDRDAREPRRPRAPWLCTGFDSVAV